MPQRDGYIPGVPCWVDVSEPDLDAAREFYGGLFGWEFEDVMPPSVAGNYFIARGETVGSSIFDTSGEPRSGDVAAIRSIPQGAPPTAMWSTYFWVDGADETVSRVREAGGGVVAEPFDFLDACRTAVLTDPEGAAFSVWEAREHKGARLVNDPGAVVFNSLNTRDAEGARSFYGSVFGWRTADIGGRAEGWTLPGYGDWLAREHHPGLRRRLARAGAPEGFEDVVGGVIPIADNQPDTPPQWSVSFATADADATAEKATELGGRVIVPPFDAPWSTDTYAIRITVIGDQQGATFTASNFMPKSKNFGS
ncbi:VOC family protein [Streptomyces sp. NPDC050704]|uniref:VOC family protein n=1 Tax=Streptomyces sp. NPDC050704 TaxID=3157219 RepID=UPI00343D6595